MNKVIIEFAKEDVEFKSLLVDLYGDGIKRSFIESNKFNGDVVDVFISIIIPVAIPFLQVLFEKRIEKNKEKESGRKVIRFIKDGNEIVFENYNIDEVKQLLTSNIQEINGSGSAK